MIKLWCAALLLLVVGGAVADSASDGQIAVGSVFLIQLHVGQGNMTLAQRANVVTGRLPTILGLPDLQPSDVTEVKQGNQYALMVRKHLLVTCTKADAAVNNVSVKKQASMWLASLKTGLMKVTAGHSVPIKKHAKL